MNKVNHKGTFLINNVPKLVVNLADKLPADGMTVVLKTEKTPVGNPLPRASSLEGWSFLYTPLQTHLDLASLGAAVGRYTLGGLLDVELTPILFGGLNQVDPLTSGASKPFNDWVDNYAYGTSYLTIIDKLMVTSDGL